MPGPPGSGQQPTYIENLLDGARIASQLYLTAAERYPISYLEVWVDLNLIPSTPPPLQEWSSVAINPIVKGLRNIPLGVDPNNPYRFSYEHSVDAVTGVRQFANMVPSRYGDSQYAPWLVDSRGTILLYDPDVWTADGVLGIVQFKKCLPVQLGLVLPIVINYWRYIGRFAGEMGPTGASGPPGPPGGPTWDPGQGA